MKRVIISYEDGVDIEDAVRRVASVISDGRTSISKHKRIFSWVTTWRDGIAVITRPPRNKNSADSFVVEKVI